MDFIDFFAGIGGVRLGLEMAGHNAVGWCEFDKHAQKSYRAMYKPDEKGEWFKDDIRTVRADELPKADMWTFGFPCQDISVAGNMHGFEGERSGLFFQIIRLLAETRQEDKPKWLLCENVKNLLSIADRSGVKGSGFLRLLIELDGVGYDVEWQLLNSKDWGVPQNRERVFIIGHLRGSSGRKIFPIERTDGTNPVELHQIGRQPGSNRDNPNQGRVYDKNGLAPSLNCMQGGGAENHILQTENVPSGKIEVVGNYSPSKHTASRVVDRGGIAPTVMENHGTVTATIVENVPSGVSANATASHHSKEITPGYVNAINASKHDSGVIIGGGKSSANAR